MKFIYQISKSFRNICNQWSNRINMNHWARVCVFVRVHFAKFVSQNWTIFHRTHIFDLINYKLSQIDINLFPSWCQSSYIQWWRWWWWMHESNFLAQKSSSMHEIFTFFLEIFGFGIFYRNIISYENIYQFSHPISLYLVVRRIYWQMTHPTTLSLNVSSRK